MTGIFVLLVSVLLVLADVIAFCTANRLYAGKFIRKLRYFVYSITPVRRIFIMIVFGIICGTADFSWQDICGLVSLLLSGLLLTYSGKILTLRQKQKKRIPANKIKLIRQKKG